METITILMSSVITGMFIMPAVAGLKKLTWFAGVEPRYMVAFFSIAFVAIMANWLAPEMTWPDIVESGLAVMGASNLTHLGVKEGKKQLKL